MSLTLIANSTLYIFKQLKLAKSHSDSELVQDNIKRALDQLESVQDNLLDLLSESNESENKKWQKMLKNNQLNQHEINKTEWQILNFSFWKGLGESTKKILLQNLYKISS